MDITDLIEKKVDDPQPLEDIAICSECGWKGAVSECKKGEEGDWESGYYPIDLCPKCKDGGCIDDYDMTVKRQEEWISWIERNEKGGGVMEKPTIHEIQGTVRVGISVPCLDCGKAHRQTDPCWGQEGWKCDYDYAMFQKRGARYCKDCLKDF